MKLSKNERIQNAAVLANSLQVSVDVIRKVAGNDVSDTVQGAPLSEVIHETAAAKIKSKLSRHFGER